MKFVCGNRCPTRRFGPISLPPWTAGPKGTILKQELAMNAPAKQWTDSEGLKYFCRHLVGLFVTYKHKTPEDAVQPDRFAACAGTLIIIDNILYFLTAGHVLKALDELRAHEKAEIGRAVLADTFGLEIISDVPIPFDLKGAQLFYIDDELEGLDFGVIALEGHYARLLAKNGAVALTEERWIHQSQVTFDGYAMLGFPEEFASQRVSQTGNAEVSPTMFRVKKLELPPAGRTPTKHPQFIGQLDPELALKSIKGMSGGPIFGFREEPNGRFRYWVVALQSSWDAGKRIVYGCSLPILASLMTDRREAAS